MVLCALGLSTLHVQQGHHQASMPWYGPFPVDHATLTGLGCRTKYVCMPAKTCKRSAWCQHHVHRPVTGDVSIEVMGGPQALGFCAGRIDDPGRWQRAWLHTSHCCLDLKPAQAYLDGLAWSALSA